MRQRLADNGIFLLRVSVAMMMLSHGIPKALGYEELVQSFPDPLNVGTEVSAMLIVFAELGCSVLLLLGLFGRVAAASLFIAMMVAAFVHHFHDPWASKELPLLYAAVFAALTLTGSGSTSIDRWFSRKVLETGERSSRAPHPTEPAEPR
ncbi:MAG: DoxX family protein [Myxococcales bacterium]|nr:DoxX family protein [Myxococcales bacterium]MDH3842665.1 DoxX family protein [Myxococcales bacterium]